jgi:cell division ATPase FtsA
MSEGQLVAGLDLGTTKVCVALGERTQDGALQLRSYGVAPTRGVKQGMVVQVEQAALAVRDAVKQAEQRCGLPLRRVLLSLSEMNTRPLPASRLANGQAPRRMQNLVQCLELAGLSIVDLVPAPLASAEALVTEQDRQLGVAVVDIGGATTDIAVFARGLPVRTSVLPVGGLHLTSDIAQGLETSLREAERVKRQHGCVFVGELDPNEELLIPSLGEQPPHVCIRAELVDIVEARASEILAGVEQALKRAELQGPLGAGLVLCGGSSQLPGLPELARQRLGVPVRCLRPVGVGGIEGRLDEPGFTAVVGLLLQAPAHALTGQAAAS